MSAFLGSEKSTLARMTDAWSAFWFTPKDPTLLGAMRILAGLVTLYTFVIHGYTMQAFLGEDAWFGLAFRKEMIADRPVYVGALLSSPHYDSETIPAAPANEVQTAWANDYKQQFGAWPAAPHPESKAEFDFSRKFRNEKGFDFRYFGLPFPKNKWENDVLEEYAIEYKQAFPPPYPANRQEVEQIKKYRDRQEQDPRYLYARGLPVFSVWLHVIDPAWMNVVQTCFVAAAVCFVLGLGTRVTSVIVWFANLCYIHRNTAMLFGVDTMMTVLLLYLMIGPSGAALSLDRVIAHWWRGSKPRHSSDSQPANDAPVPRVSANVALRMMQIHLCIIYFVSGLSKLQGMSWWNGTAVWNVLGNFEFAPMHLEEYRKALQFLGHNQLLFDTSIAGAGLMTLAFEIGYPFLIWRPNTRWVFLAGAIFMHGFIGLFMGLKTFSLLMLVFNMAFLRPEKMAQLFSGVWAAKRTQTTAAPIRRRPEAIAK